MADTKHNHNDGRALPFGQKMPEGECPRCDELRNGATARAGWVDKTGREIDRRISEWHRANVAKGLCICGRHPADGRICTYGDW